jgi:general secretion pathway protein K
MKGEFGSACGVLRSSGSALLAVLWVVAFLSFLVITSMMIVTEGADAAVSRILVLRARQLAEMGLAVGANPAVTKSDDRVLHSKFSAGESFDVALSTEEGRLNINFLLTEERRGILERLFQIWGLSVPDSVAVVDCLMDWVDADDFRRLNGAEKQDYEKEGFAGRPFNRAFRSIDEMTLVKSMEKVTMVNPRWREAFTVWGAGALDVNEASADLIAAVADVPLAIAAQLVAARNGPDGLAHTDDDALLQSMEEVMAFLGAGKNSGTASVPLVLKGSVRRIESTGRAGGLVRRISVILQGTPSGGIADWHESAE